MNYTIKYKEDDDDNTVDAPIYIHVHILSRSVALQRGRAIFSVIADTTDRLYSIKLNEITLYNSIF